LRLEEYELEVVFQVALIEPFVIADDGRNHSLSRNVRHWFPFP
jgi:hypothetical protein